MNIKKIKIVRTLVTPIALLCFMNVTFAMSTVTIKMQNDSNKSFNFSCEESGPFVKGKQSVSMTAYPSGMHPASQQMTMHLDGSFLAGITCKINGKTIMVGQSKNLEAKFAYLGDEVLSFKVGRADENGRSKVTAPPDMASLAVQVLEWFVNL